MTYHNIESLIAQCSPDHLTQYDLIDRYTDDTLPKGYYSLTLRFIFRSMERTLESSEITCSIQKLLHTLEGAGVRLR